MGSRAETAEETVEYLQARGEKVGVVKVRLFRPFSPAALTGIQRGMGYLAAERAAADH